MGIFGKLTEIASQLGTEVKKAYKGAANYKTPEEIAEERSKRADKIKILVQCPGGSDLEIYDDFIIGYPTQSSLGMGLLKAAINSEDTVFPMMIANLTASFSEPDPQNNSRRLLLTSQMSNGKEQTVGFVITPENEQAIMNAYNYIIDFQQNPRVIDDAPSLGYKFEGYSASKQVFPLLGQQLLVSEELDAYNQYQRLYQKLAWEQAEKAKRAMERRIFSYETYKEFLADIVYEYGLPLFELAQDICIANGIYSEDERSIFKTHYTIVHNLERCVNTVGDYAQQISAVKSSASNATVNMNYTKTTAVFGTSKSEVQKAARKANFSNAMTDVKAGLMSNIFSHLTAEDKDKIYEKFNIEREHFVEAIYQDFWGMCLTLNKILAANKKAVWSKASISDAESRMIDNMSRSDFPEDKIPEFILSLLQKNPYDRRTYSFLTSKYGKTDEISAIMDYFCVNV